MRILICCACISFFGLQTQAGQMRTFLTDCAYGTIGGALVGLASVAISDNPGGKINNVARGASLGLYAGIGFGLYEINQNQNKNYDSFRIHFEPNIISDGRADGVLTVVRFSK